MEKNNQQSFWGFGDKLASSMANVSLNDSSNGYNEVAAHNHSVKNHNSNGALVSNLPPNNPLAGFKFNKANFNAQYKALLTSMKSGNKDDKDKMHDDEEITHDVAKNNKTSNLVYKKKPPIDSVPVNEDVGGYIFVCNNETMAENLRRQLFGVLPLPLF
ncbi:hypothetical protein RIF29_26950 [Crotalaria pallida]|uniref:DCD domain-containing protein n=1 Tax=Crotalaria pallida TaxID=3830 RepID=A0AAN9HYC9_CROPI